MGQRMESLTAEQRHPSDRRRPFRRRRRPDRLGPATVGLLCTLIFGSVLAFGSMPFWATWLDAGIAVVGGFLSLRALPRPPRPFWVLSGMGILCLLQALPLPLSWVQYLSPTAGETWARSLLPFAETPRFAALSIDPGASLAEALKWLSYANCFVLASRVRARHGSSALATLLVAAGALVALLTLLHGAGNFRLVYGLYEPSFKVARFSVGPLLNSNNLAGYVCLGLFAGCSVLLGPKSLVPKATVAAGMAVMLTALLLSGSRAGIMACSVGATALLLAARRSMVVSSRAASALRIAMPMGAALLLIAMLGSARRPDALTAADVERKVAVWKWSLGMIREHAWFGVGRGAFESAFPPYREALARDWTTTFSHAENFIVQWTSEWGVLFGGILSVMTAAYAAQQWWRSQRELHRFALLTGFCVLLLQNLADLGLELPALCFAAILAMVGGGRSAELSSRPDVSLARQRSWLPSVLLCVVWLAAPLLARWPVNAERQALATSYASLDLKNPNAKREYRSALFAAMRRHPGEAYFPLMGAVVAQRSGSDNPLPWISRALERAPLSGPVHLALAEIVARHGALSQAMLHLRLAATYDSTLSATVGKRAAIHAPTITLLLEALPEGSRGDLVLRAACQAAPGQSYALDCWRAFVERAPHDLFAVEQRIETLLKALAGDDIACADELAELCDHEAEAAIAAFLRDAPSDWRPGYYRAQLLMHRGQFEEAAVILANTCPADVAGAECSRDFVRAALATKTGSPLRIEALEAFAARSCGEQTTCANANDWLASQLSARGDTQLALNHGIRAAEAEVTAGRWLRVADLAIAAQQYAEVRAAVSRADRAPDATAATRARGEVMLTRSLRTMLR